MEEKMKIIKNKLDDEEDWIEGQTTRTETPLRHEFSQPTLKGI